MGVEKTLDGKRHRACANGFGLDGSNVEVSRIGLEGEELALLPEIPPIEEFGFPAAQLLNTEEALIQFNDVSFGRDDSELLRNVEMGIHEQCRIGVVGKNGVGKSTFLQLLMGELEPTAGEIKQQRGLKLAYIGQHDVENMRLTTQSPLEYFAQAFPSAKEHEVVEK